jgi:hypothetical protein
MLFAALLLAIVAPVEAEDASLVYESPRGTYRFERIGDEPAVVVSTKGAAERVRLPGAAAEDQEECHVIYGASPNEQWLYRTESWRHHGVQGRILYTHVEGAKFAPYKGEDWFKQAAETFVLKNSGFRKSDFFEKRGPQVSEDHFDAFFGGWSMDSRRLLIEVRGGGTDRDEAPAQFFVYFNTQTKSFELTPYLRAMNKRQARHDTPLVVACAEPVDPLPSAAELQARYEKVEKELKELYEYRIANPRAQDADSWRAEQSEGRQAIEAGLKLYLEFAPKKEQEARRWQYLADTTLVELARQTFRSR